MSGKEQGERTTANIKTMASADSSEGGGNWGAQSVYSVTSQVLVSSQRPIREGSQVLDGTQLPAKPLPGLVHSVSESYTTM